MSHVENQAKPELWTDSYLSVTKWAVSLLTPKIPGLVVHVSVDANRLSVFVSSYTITLLATTTDCGNSTPAFVARLVLGAFIQGFDASTLLAKKEDQKLTQGKINAKRTSLLRTVSEISEHMYHAGWMQGIEVIVWKNILDIKRNEYIPDMDTDSRDMHLECMMLSDELGEWCWNLPEHDKEHTIPLSVWADYYTSISCPINIMSLEYPKKDILDRLSGSITYAGFMHTSDPDYENAKKAVTDGLLVVTDTRQQEHGIIKFAITKKGLEVLKQRQEQSKNT